MSDDSSQGNGQQRNVGDGIEVGGTFLAAHPKPFLSSGLETGVIAFAFGAQGVHGLEADAGAIDGQAVIIWDGDVLGTAPVLFAIVPVFVVTWTGGGFGQFEWAGEFLPNATPVKGLHIVVHSKARFT